MDFIDLRPWLFGINYMIVWIYYLYHIDKIITDIETNAVLFIILLTIVSLNMALLMLLIEYLLYSFFEKIFDFKNEYKMKRERQKIFENRINVQDIEISSINCCICLEPINEGIKLNCSHILHEKCLEQLIDCKFRDCPLCAQNIV